LLTRLATDIRKQTKASGVTVHNAFIGVAHYAHNQLLHPDLEVRDVAKAWLKRAYRFAANAGIQRVGGPPGAIASRRDCREAESIPEIDYQDLIERMHRLAEAAKAEGVIELFVEPTPMRREWPWTVAQAVTMADDVADAAVPWTFCVDWGHGAELPGACRRLVVRRPRI
jgi:sugar phosphate isomerase/epimerase